MPDWGVASIGILVVGSAGRQQSLRAHARIRVCIGIPDGIEQKNHYLILTASLTDSDSERVET